MPHNPTLLQQRNTHIKIRFRFHRKRNPKWTIIAVIEEVADEVFLSPTTIGKILKTQDCEVPCADTVAKHSRKAVA